MADVGLIPSPNYAAFQQPQAANPLQTAGQVVGLGQNMLQMQGLNQTMQARAALGPIAQSSVDPTTGQMDYGKYATLVASDPRTAWMAPDILNSIAQRDLTQAQTIKTGLENSISTQKLIGAVTGELQQQGIAVTRDQYQQRIMETPGLIQAMGGPTGVARFMATLPPDGAPLAQYTKQAYTRSMIAQGNLEGAYGKLAPPIVTGGTTTIGKEYQGQFSPQGTINQTPTSAENSALYTQATPGGTFQGVRGANPALAPLPGGYLGGPGNLPPGGAGASAPGAGAGPGGGGANLPPPASLPSGQPNAQGGMVQTGLSPQDTKLYEGLGEAQTKFTTELNTGADKAMQAIPQIDRLLSILPSITTGGWAQAKTELANFVGPNGLGLSKDLTDAIANGNLSNSQEAQKIFARLSTELMSTDLAGGGRFTNKEFEVYQKYNANLGTTQAAADSMLNFQKMLLQQRVEQQQAYAGYLTQYKNWGATNPGKPNPYDPAMFQSKWNQHLEQSGELYKIPNVPQGAKL